MVLDQVAYQHEARGVKSLLTWFNLDGIHIVILPTVNIFIGLKDMINK